MNKIVKNASWIIGCKIAETVFMLVVTMFQTRIFGPTNFGLITYAQSIVTIVVPVMQLGLNSILVKEIVDHREKEGEITGTAVTMAMIASPVSILAVLIFVSIVNTGSTETIMVCLLYSVLLLFQVFELLQYWFLSHYMSMYVAITIFVAYVLTSIYKLLVLFINRSVYCYAVSQAIYYLIIAIALLYFFKKKSKQKLSFKMDTAKYLFSKSKFFFISSVAVAVYTQLDRVLLKNICGDTANGYYVAAITVVNMATFIFTAIIDSTQPDLFEKRSRSSEEFEKGMIGLYSVVIYLALAMCVGLTVLSPLVIKIMCGSEYGESVNLLRIVCWYGLFSFIGIARNVYIVAEGKERYIWVINCIGALFSLVSNYVLISLIGATGAAVAAVLIQIFVNVIMGYAIKPIRRNNQLMLQALNPSNILGLFRRGGKA